MNALYFTLLQAGLSALGASIIGAILAYVLVRFQPKPMAWVEALLILPFFLPALTVVISVLGFYGRSGLNLPVFGLFGILMAHWILNAPLVMLVVLRGYRLLPETHRRLALQYDDIWRLIDFPVLKQALPLGFGLAFLYASLSFTIVLTLGGTSDTTTLEVGIFQAIRYDFDLFTAFKFATLQMGLGLIIYFFLNRDFETHWPSAQMSDALPSPKSRANWSLVLVLFFLCAIILLAPVFMFIAQGLVGFDIIFQIRGMVRAIMHSVALGILAVFFCQLMVALIFRFRLASLVWVMGAMSPIVLALGIIFSLRPLLNPFAYGVEIVAFLQAIAMLPLVYGLWKNKLRSIPSEELKLVELLMVSKWERFVKFWWRIIWPISLETSALCFVLSLGDLGLMPLFSPPDFETLPSLVWQLIGNYKFEQARSLGVFILMMSFCILAASRAVLLIRRAPHA